MNRVILKSILGLFLVFLIGCSPDSKEEKHSILKNNSDNVEIIDRVTSTMYFGAPKHPFKTEIKGGTNNMYTYISRIKDNKANEEYFYGMEKGNYPSSLSVEVSEREINEILKAIKILENNIKRDNETSRYNSFGDFKTNLGVVIGYKLMGENLEWYLKKGEYSDKNIIPNISKLKTVFKKALEEIERIKNNEINPSQLK